MEQQKTTTQKITTYFGLTNREFYTLLKDESKLRGAVKKFCDLANIKVEEFKHTYRSIEEQHKMAARYAES